MMIHRPLLAAMAALTLAALACGKNPASPGAGGGGPGGLTTTGSSNAQCPSFCQHVIEPGCPKASTDTCVGACEDLFSRCPALAQTYFDCAKDIPINCDGQWDVTPCADEWNTLVDCANGSGPSGPSGSGPGPSNASSGSGTPLGQLGDPCTCSGPEGTVICQSTDGPCDPSLWCLNNHGVCASSCDDGNGNADPSLCPPGFQCSVTEIGLFCLQ